MRFLSSEYPPCPPEEALFHVIPAPWESSVSYGGGTAGGPAAILAASDQLERWDGTSSPGDHGIHTADTIDCAGTPGKVFPRITAAVDAALAAGAVPVMLGGEHSITAAAYDAVAGFYRDTAIGVIQIDAHADLRDRYQGNEYSHASVIHRLHQRWFPPVFQVGVRALCTEEVSYRHRYADDPRGPIGWLDARDLVPPASRGFSIPERFPDRVYLTVDVDGLDPSVCPATGTPVPGGLSWYQALEILETVCRTRTVVAYDVVELAPVSGLHSAEYAAAELTYRIMGMISRHQSQNST